MIKLFYTIWFFLIYHAPDFLRTECISPLNLDAFAFCENKKIHFWEVISSSHFILYGSRFDACKTENGDTIYCWPFMTWEEWNAVQMDRYAQAHAIGKICREDRIKSIHDIEGCHTGKKCYIAWQHYLWTRGWYRRDSQR